MDPVTERSEEEKADIKRRFAARRRNQLLLTIPLVVIVGLLIYYKKNPPEAIAGMSRSTFQTLMFVLVIGALAFSFFNWRCPGCSSYLGRSLAPKFCPKCGVELK